MISNINTNLDVETRVFNRVYMKFLYALNPNRLRALAVAARCGRINAREKKFML